MLLDFWLAGLDAPRFMREMESTWGELPCPCIVLTGAGDEGAAAEAMRAGAFYYLPKGATAAALIHQLHQATAAARLRQELKEQQAVQAAAEASRREAQLAAAELAGVRKAVATLMHELNSPLTGVLHCILMLLDACTEEQRPWLLQMEEACQRMVRVMRRMEELESLRPRRAVDPGGPLDLAPPDQPGLTPAELPGQPPEPRDAAPSP
jgi:signal transduction histidine kinase